HLGRAELKRRYQRRSPRSAFRAISELQKDSTTDDLGLFLLGREPVWADLLEGYAVERSFDRNLIQEVANSHLKTVILTGTAATGKSTSAMRLALALDAQGRRAYTFDPIEGGSRIRTVVDLARSTVPDVL